jgi:hypothetical protein
MGRLAKRLVQMCALAGPLACFVYVDPVLVGLTGRARGAPAEPVPGGQVVAWPGMRVRAKSASGRHSPPDWHPESPRYR